MGQSVVLRILSIDSILLQTELKKSFRDLSPSRLSYDVTIRFVHLWLIPGIVCDSIILFDDCQFSSIRSTHTHTHAHIVYIYLFDRRNINWCSFKQIPDDDVTQCNIDISTVSLLILMNQTSVCQPPPTLTPVNCTGDILQKENSF